MRKHQEHPRTPAVPTLCTKDLKEKENNKEALEISVQHTVEHLLPPPPSKTPKMKKMKPAHQDSEEHPRRHRCIVDLYPHPPRPTG
jgi:hypothetical protein